MSAAPLRRIRPLAILALILLPLLGGLQTAAQEGQVGSGPIAPISLELTLDAVTEPGSRWQDGDVLRVRGMRVAFAVAGDLSGTATLEIDSDGTGPCDADTGLCAGTQQSFASVELVTEDATWSGSLALEINADQRPLARGILIGRRGAADQVLTVNAIGIGEGGALTISGDLATLDGPIGGVQLSQSACLTSETSADGGFLGGQGLIVDNGPARITRHDLGLGAPLALHGELTDVGYKGIVRGMFVVDRNGPHGHGSFVLIGESGAYRGMIGYGRALLSLTEEPRCQSGIALTSSWTGQARFVSDPAGFLAPRVYFRTPVDGATVPTPVEVDLGAEHVQIEPAGTARDGAGYLVVIVDAPCSGPGEPVPEDEQHIHLRDGETAARLNLFSGKHRLCLQLADGAGIAQPATDVITIVVASSGGEGNL